MHAKFSRGNHAPGPGLRFALTTCALAALLAIGVPATGAPAHAAGARHLVSNEGQASGAPVWRSLRGDPLRYWTPQRLRNARPMKLPEVDAFDLEPSFTPQSARRDSPRLEPGSTPSVDLRPDLEERLFEPAPATGTLEPLSALEAAPIDPAELAPYSMSADGALYTNSRVFPREALLVYPYATTGRLFASDPQRNAQLTCSAAVIQRRLIATAGHCVYDAAGGYSYTNFVFVPAYDEGAAPFGVWTARAVITTAACVNGGGIPPTPPTSRSLCSTRPIRPAGRSRSGKRSGGWAGRAVLPPVAM